MSFLFTIPKYPRDDEEEADILRTIGKYDPDYAALMAINPDDFNNGIDWKMVQGGANYILSPEIPDDKIRSFLFDLIQKKWCGFFFDPEMQTDEAIYYASRDDGVQASSRLIEFMCVAKGDDKNFPMQGDFKTGKEFAQAMKPFLRQPI